MNSIEGTPPDPTAKTAAAEPPLVKTFVQGLWENNPGLCQLLGLCPLLAVSNTATSALGLGLATLFVVCVSSVLVALLRHLIWPEIRIPLYIALIAALVTVVSFVVEAYYPSLYHQLGIYLALIVTNCIIMGRAEAFAGHHRPLSALADASGCGLGFIFVLLALGSLREIIGQGTLFANAENLLGAWARGLEIDFFPADQGLLIAVLPPGGFFVLALLVALKNALDARRERARQQQIIPSRQI